MPRRPTPTARDVAPVLRPLGRAHATKARADTAFDAALLAASNADPRPTNAQIAEALGGIDESTVRYMIAQARKRAQRPRDHNRG